MEAMVTRLLEQEDAVWVVLSSDRKMPVLRNLKTKILLAKDDTALTRDIKKIVIEDLHARYTDPSVLKLLSTATFLDPRFKTDYCEDKEDLKKSNEEQAKEFMQPESTAESHKQSTAQ